MVIVHLHNRLALASMAKLNGAKLLQLLRGLRLLGIAVTLVAIASCDSGEGIKPAYIQLVAKKLDANSTKQVLAANAATAQAALIRAYQAYTTMLALPNELNNGREEFLQYLATQADPQALSTMNADYGNALLINAYNFFFIDQHNNNSSPQLPFWGLNASHLTTLEEIGKKVVETLPPESMFALLSNNPSILRRPYGFDPISSALMSLPPDLEASKKSFYQAAQNLALKTLSDGYIQEIPDLMVRYETRQLGKAATSEALIANLTAAFNQHPQLKDRFIITLNASKPEKPRYLIEATERSDNKNPNASETTPPLAEIFQGCLIAGKAPKYDCQPAEVIYAQLKDYLSKSKVNRILVSFIPHSSRNLAEVADNLDRLKLIRRQILDKQQQPIFALAQIKVNAESNAAFETSLQGFAKDQSWHPFFTTPAVGKDDGLCHQPPLFIAADWDGNELHATFGSCHEELQDSDNLRSFIASLIAGS